MGVGTVSFPAGFSAIVGNIGIKDEFDDVLVLVAEETAVVSGLYTKSRFAGPSVRLSRLNSADNKARAFVVVARNANVATGAEGDANAAELVSLTASLVGCTDSEVLVAATGVIGRLLPMDKVRDWFLLSARTRNSADVEAAARAIMTTDAVPKVAESVLPGGARVVGIAKGVGMIEPDMATMITALTTDAAVAAADLDAIWRRVVDRTFNAVSIDTDTSTSDMALLLASGVGGPVDLAHFEVAVRDVALSLTKQIAFDGEGAQTLIEVRVDGAADTAQAKRVAKAVVNSPLVKTAVHGADPNWGRVAMAIGKCSDDTDIEPGKVVIRFGADEVYPRLVSDDDLAELSQYMAGDEVLIHVSLGVGPSEFTAYGCDLTDGYVRLNADYTT